MQITRRNFLKTTGLATLTGIVGLTNESYANNNNLNLAYAGYIEKENRFFGDIPQRTDKYIESFLDFYHSNAPEKITPSSIEFKGEKKKSYLEIKFKSRVNHDLIEPHELTMEDHGGKGPIIIILPASGGISFLERIFSRSFRNEGFHPIIIEPNKAYRKSFMKSFGNLEEGENIGKYAEVLNQGYEQTLLDYMQHISLIKQKNPNNPLYAIGFSLGGIGLLSLSGIDNRIEAAFSALSSGNIPAVLANSTEPGIREGRKSFMEKTGFSKRDIERQLRGKIPLDPMNLTHRIDPDDLFMVLASNDSMVPIKNGIEFAKRVYPYKEVKRTPSNINLHLNGKFDHDNLQGNIKFLHGLTHYTSIFAWLEIKKQAVNFYNTHN